MKSKKLTQAEIQELAEFYGWTDIDKVDGYLVLYEDGTVYEEKNGYAAAGPFFDGVGKEDVEAILNQEA